LSVERGRERSNREEHEGIGGVGLKKGGQRAN